MLLTIPAWNNDNYLSLEEILILLKKSCERLYWRLDILEVAPEPGSAVLSNINPEVLMSYQILLELVSPKLQIIDGEVISDDKESGLYVLIRAVDSTSWDIDTNMPNVIAEVKCIFVEGKDWRNLSDGINVNSLRS